MAHFVYDDEEQERWDNLKENYQKIVPKGIRRILRKTFTFKVVRSYMVCREKTFFPDMKRKSGIVRFWECMKWLFKYNHVCLFYNRFGLDIKDFHKPKDYLDFSYVKKQRALVHHKGHPLEKVRKANINTRYSIIADDKFLFYSYIEKMFPQNIPSTKFAFMGNKVIVPFDESTNTEKAFKSLPDGKYICKPNIGSHGDLIVAITKEKNKLKFNDPEVNIDTLIERSAEKPFLVQSFIKQHEDINKVNNATVNTIRIITTRWNTETHILAAMLRVGASKEKVVDNADAGGTFIGIDIDKGTLKEYGYFYNKPRTKKHPITGLVYKGYKLPYWAEVIKLVKDLHPIIFGFATIGWDIAITPDGPVIVEINWNYSLKGIQVCNGGLKPRWEELKNK